MEFTARQIAEALQGVIDGNPEAKVHTVARIEEGKEGALSFLANPKYSQHIYGTASSVVIVNEDFEPEQPVSATLIRVKDAYSAFASILDYYNKAKQPQPGIAKFASIDETATLGQDVYIGDFTYIGRNVEIGDGCMIYPNTYIGDNVTIAANTEIHPGVKIYSESVVGMNCIIHGGVVIGSDGFGFAPQDTKDYKKIAQIGNVIIEDYVEIGSNTTIDRATIGSTIIRKGVKLDNLIQIAHNVEIGENTVIAAQTGISGSTKIGKNCMIAGQVGITGHLIIADEVKIGAQSGISTNIKQKGQVVLGSPAFEISKYRRSYVHFRNLGSVIERLDRLEKELKERQ